MKQLDKIPSLVQILVAEWLAVMFIFPIASKLYTSSRRGPAGYLKKSAPDFYYLFRRKIVMKSFIATIATIIFFASISFAQPKNPDGPCKSINKKTAALITEYKELRNKRRQLPPGTFDNDVSGHGGRFYSVMSSLGVELGHPPYTRKIITGCLGEPDAVRNHKQMSNFLDIYNREQRKAGRKPEARSNREYLIYFWRGWHDFMFFITEDGVIQDHGWWFAYE